MIIRKILGRGSRQARLLTKDWEQIEILLQAAWL